MEFNRYCLKALNECITKAKPLKRLEKKSLYDALDEASYFSKPLDDKLNLSSEELAEIDKIKYDELLSRSRHIWNYTCIVNNVECPSKIAMHLIKYFDDRDKKLPDALLQEFFWRVTEKSRYLKPVLAMDMVSKCVESLDKTQVKRILSGLLGEIKGKQNPYSSRQSASLIFCWDFMMQQLISRHSDNTALFQDCLDMYVSHFTAHRSYFHHNMPLLYRANTLALKKLIAEFDQYRCMNLVKMEKDRIETDLLELITGGHMTSGGDRALSLINRARAEHGKDVIKINVEISIDG